VNAGWVKLDAEAANSRLADASWSALTPCSISTLSVIGVERGACPGAATFDRMQHLDNVERKLSDDKRRRDDEGGHVTDLYTLNFPHLLTMHVGLIWRINYNHIEIEGKP